MPELPEVETIVRGLREMVLSLEISDVDIRMEKCIAGPLDGLIAALRGREIVGVERRGKNIIFRLGDGGALLAHLRMTGKFRFVPEHTPLEKHTHVILSFKGRPDQLRFVDPRRFGRLMLDRSGEGKMLSHLGPEPLEVSAEEFIRRARDRRRAIKALLLDQTFLAGVGNIYADEALHRARIHPRRQSGYLAEAELRRLWRELRRILREAIRAGGTSVRSYVNAGGSPGGFQKRLRAYGREGAPCGNCGRLIRREQVGGRSTFFCPRCQPANKRK